MSTKYLESLPARHMDATTAERERVSRNCRLGGTHQERRAMTVKIISPEQRRAEPRGARIVVTGPFGVGKTSLVRTLDPGERVPDHQEPVQEFPAACGGASRGYRHK
jgi:putative ribosome biogenesis GTPase RsgA